MYIKHHKFTSHYLVTRSLISQSLGLQNSIIIIIQILLMINQVIKTLEMIPFIFFHIESEQVNIGKPLLKIMTDPLERANRQYRT